MGDAKFTPGPWEVQPIFPGRCRVVSKERDLDVCDLRCDENDEEAVAATHADALLIAKAPDLYELVEWALDEGVLGDGEWRLKATAALAKARGEP